MTAWDGAWWAITTVGYGDSFPKTDAGRVIAIAVMIRAREAEQQRADLQDRLDEIARRLDAIDRRG